MIKVYFTDIKSEILNAISGANNSLKIAVAWFTHNEIYDTLLTKCRQSKIDVQLIIICDSINIKPLGLDFNDFIQAGGKLYFGDSESLMHHKFCIVDNCVLINGSYNWTFWAETKNKENITVITGESEAIDNFNKEFENLIADKQQIQSVNLKDLITIDNDDHLLNNKVVNVNEYISSAVYLGQTGNNGLAADIFQEVNSLNPVMTNKAIQTGLLSGQYFYKDIYNRISAPNPNASSEKTYKQYCSDIKYLIRFGNYVDAIATANSCAIKYPDRFSVHVYCGDAKLKLNDIAGAKIEYLKAFNYNHTEGAKIIYYDKVYNYSYFPFADLYRKLGERDKMIQILKDAVVRYRNLNIQKGLTRAEGYLKRLENNETLTSIE